MTQQPRTPTTRNDEWWHERHGLHNEAHHQAHRPLDLCVPLWSDAAVHSQRADLLARIEKAVRELHDWRPVEGGTLGRGAQRCAFKGCDDTPERHVTWANVLAALLAAAPVEPEE